MADDESWEVNRKHVLAELDRFSDSLERFESKIDKKLSKLSDDIVSLKVKAGIWGFICGLIPAAFGVLLSKSQQ